MPRLSWRRYGKGESGTEIVLCHGFLANMDDLADVARRADPEGRHSWRLPQAPIQVFPGAWAWFPSDPEDIGSALQGVLWGDLASFDSPSIDRALAMLLEDIGEMDMDGKKLLLGGFSQGSMMALLAGLSRPCSSIALFSSALFSRGRLESLLRQAPPRPILMRHGMEDPVLPYRSALDLRDLLVSYGQEVAFSSFHGGHGIEEVGIRDLAELASRN